MMKVIPLRLEGNVPLSQIQIPNSSHELAICANQDWKGLAADGQCWQLTLLKAWLKRRQNEEDEELNQNFFGYDEIQDNEDCKEVGQYFLSKFCFHVS
jgi:hypothetical protein